jgi:hypothetical protein
MKTNIKKHKIALLDDKHKIALIDEMIKDIKGWLDAYRRKKAGSTLTEGKVRRGGVKPKPKNQRPDVKPIPQKSKNLGGSIMDCGAPFGACTTCEHAEGYHLMCPIDLGKLCSYKKVEKPV